MAPVRKVVAVLLTLAAFALPMAMDHCALTCAIGAAATPTARPACHHAGSAAQNIGTEPTRCAHSHDGMVMAAPAGTFDVASSSAALPIAAPSSYRASAAAPLHTPAAAARPPDLARARAASPLRV